MKYGTSLRLAQRPGWEAAYLDYDTLKRLLGKIEALFDRANAGAPTDHSSTVFDGGDDSCFVPGEIGDEETNGQQRKQAAVGQEKNGTMAADVNARILAEKFFHLLRNEVEKVSLFTLARQGELADAVGALRCLSREETHESDDESTSSEEEGDAMFRPLLGDSGMPNVESETELDALLQRSRKTRRGSTSQPSSTSTSSGRPGSLFRKSHVLKNQQPAGGIFSNTARNDLNAMDEYTRVGVELLHLLRFICVNAMGVRKILKKHDKLLSNFGFFCGHGGRAQTSNKTNKPKKQPMSTRHLTPTASDSEPGKHHRRGQSMPEHSSSQDVVFLASSDSATRNSGQLQGGNYIEQRYSIQAAAPGSHRLLGGIDAHMQQLANSRSVEAISSSLESALAEYEWDSAHALASRSPKVSRSQSPLDIALMRLRCVVSSINTLRDCCGTLNTPLDVFLSRRAMMVTGRDLGGLTGASKEALEFLLRYRPDSALYLDAANLRDWWERHLEEDALSIIRPEVGADDDLDLVHIDRREKITSLELALNLASTLLYTSNYYIIAPTANHYAGFLGKDTSFGATLIGASSFAAIFAAFLYSFWCTRITFRSALIVSAICPLFGNLLYLYAITCHSYNVALVGRIFVGLGAAEVVNRQLISVCVPYRNITRQSALFVIVGAMGMSVGPLLAAFLDLIAGRDPEIDFQVPVLGGIVFDSFTSPGFLMASLWLLQLLCLVCFFEEPRRINGGINTRGHTNSDATLSTTTNDETMGVQMTSAPSDDKTSYGSIAENDDKQDQQTFVMEKKETTWLGSTFIQAAHVWGLIFSKVGLPITFVLFSFVELVDEVLISSCSMVVHRYFNMHGSRAGFIIACLGAFVIPADVLVERAEHYYDDRQIIIKAIIVIGVGFGFILNYEEAFSALTFKHDKPEDVSTTDDDDSLADLLNRQLHAEARPYNWGFGFETYLVSLSTIFFGTIILESAVMSLMSKVTPPKLNDTFLNCGLLATLIGTVGRVAGDGMTTVTGLLDKNIFDFVNATFLPLLLLCTAAYWLVQKYYFLLL